MQLIQTAPGCKYSIVARVDTTIYSPDQTWTLDVPAGQYDFIAETDKIIIPGDAMMVRKSGYVEKDLERVNVLGNGSGSLATFVTRAVEQIVGKGNVSVKLNNDTATLTVAVALDTTEAQLANVQTLLDRVLPRNLVTEMEWLGGLPLEYTPIEYLESTGTQYIDTKSYATGDILSKVDFVPVVRYGLNGIYGDSHTDAQAGNFVSYGYSGAMGNGLMLKYDTTRLYVKAFTDNSSRVLEMGVRYTVEFKKNLFFKNGAAVKSFYDSEGFEYQTFECAQPLLLFGMKYQNNINYARARVHSFELKNVKRENGITALSFLPALDPTGAPCMYDAVTRQPFYNAGSGDFMYPGAEQAVQTLALDWDAKSYAKLTEHGVRRLYHVPEGYAGSMDGYAAANGFKELVEPPAPLEGYWMPQWRETETQLICDWVETEPPTEELPNA